MNDRIEDYAHNRVYNCQDPLNRNAPSVKPAQYMQQRFNQKKSEYEKNIQVNSMQIKLIFTCILILGGSFTFAQKKTDPISLFKMMLFLNNENAIFRGMDSTVTKGDSLYEVFNKVLILKLDTLKTNNLLSNNSENQIKIYKVDPSNISTTRPLKENEGQFIGIAMGRSCNYILAINLETGICYRLHGFRGNDFLIFLADLKNFYKEEKRNPLSNSIFFKKYKVEDIDFECLYNGLRAKDYDSDKYPCLKSCSDPIPAHAPIR